MTQFAIFESRFGKPDEAPIAVAEKFSWLAALLPPVFFVRHGLLLELVAFVLVFVALGFAGRYVGSAAVFWLYVLLAAWLGFAAPSLWRAALQRSGWRYRADLTAPAADTARLVWLKLGAPR